MSGRLADKRALVTAAGQGIGAAVARALAADGASVVATDRDPDLLDALGRADGIATRPLDVTDDGAVRAAADETGTVDVLVNCAGIVHHGSVLECGDDDWDLAFDLNVKSMYRTIRAWLPGMLAAGGGSIVNVASVASSVKGVPNRFAYGASKAAVIGLTKSVAADFMTRGVRCNAVCPGTVDTPSLRDRVAAAGGEEARRVFVARQPMGRLGTADEIAAAVVHLASDESAFTTGAVLIVDGGMTL